MTLTCGLIPAETTLADVQNAPPPSLRKHRQGQENDGHTGSWCLDKVVLARDARYQKDVCHRKPAHTSP